MPPNARFLNEQHHGPDSELIERAPTDEGYKTYTETWFARLAPYYGVFDALVRGVRSDVVAYSLHGSY